MRRIKWERIIAVLVILPSILAIAIFVYGFIGFTGFASLTKWNNLLPDFTLVGFSNYQKLFANQRFQIDLRNTVSFTLLFLFLCLVVGFLLAFVARCMRYHHSQMPGRVPVMLFGRLCHWASKAVSPTW